MLNERAADVIARDLERRISIGDLPDNTPLPAEKELGAEYRASRTVIREAISTLTSRGMLENRPRYRPIVRTPGFDAAFDSMGGVVQRLIQNHSGVKTLYESRIFFERALVREAAERAKSDDIRELRAALSANHDSIENSDDFYATDVAFHHVFYCIPKNPIYPAIHQSYTQWLAEAWKTMERSPKHNAENYDHHLAIFNAILERDAAAADAALECHLQNAWERVKDNLNVDLDAGK